VTLTRRSAYLVQKRLADIVVSGLLLVVLAPVLALVALVIVIDSPGPVLFVQQRTGRDGRRFAMYKFRTMVPDADALKAELKHLNVLEPPDFKIPRDPRITRVGAILRKTSIDELPQLLNVLAGKMTLVGPRPTSFAASTYELWYTSRLEATPGITGLWQVSGRHAMSMDERLRLDLAYLRSRSVLLDIRILLKTAGVVLRGLGA
jgi:lipopolysaccharide/colanic/teichoic acid biosynthesis glycosyltransferase